MKIDVGMLSSGWTSHMSIRVIAYIDGFNLYYGMREAGLKQCYWLNVKRLMEMCLRADQELLHMNYFTARVRPTRHNPDKHRRQAAYIEALQTVKGLTIFFGHYLSKSVTCIRCNATWESFSEKMTDVSIASELLMDACHDRFDVALLVSGDSDLCPPVQMVRREFPSKKIVVIFPPKRVSTDLYNATTAPFTSSRKAPFVLGRKKLLDAQFPDRVKKEGGYELIRPEKWRKQSTSDGGNRNPDSCADSPD